MANKRLGVDKALRFGQKVFTSALRRRGIGNQNSLNFWQDFSPQWVGYFNKQQYQYIYELNPVVKTVIDIKARAQSNVKRFVRDLKTGDILKPDTNDKVALKIYSLLKKPNPWQSEFEFFNQRKVNLEVFGNSFVYANTPLGRSDVDFRTIASMINLPSQYTKIKHTGKVFDQLDIEGIVDKYIFEVGIIKKEFDPKFILHRNDINISGFTPSMNNSEHGVTSGMSRLNSLMMPVSNIQKSFESRNVIITRRGALGIFSSELKDAGSNFPMTPEQETQVQDKLNNYGTLTNQNMFTITRMPVKYTPITQSVKDLMLFEEIQNDTIIISTSYGVPKSLTSNSLKGTTFANQQAEVRRLYNETLIPEGDDDNEALNQFLKTRENGYEIVNSYDHIDALQENKKEEADRMKITNDVAFSLFKADSITINEWLDMIGKLPVAHGEIRISQMDDKQIAILLGQFTFTEQLKTEDNG